MLRALTHSLVFSLLLFTGCTPQSLSSSLPSTSLSNEAIPGKLLFLGYVLKKDSVTGWIGATLVQQLLVEGKAEAFLKVQEPAPGDILITFLDGKGKPLSQVVQRNPFIKTVEGVSAQGVLGYKQIQLNRAELLLRVGYDPRIKSVALSFLDAHQTKQSFLSHTL